MGKTLWRSECRKQLYWVQMYYRNISPRVYPMRFSKRSYLVGQRKYIQHRPQEAAGAATIRAPFTGVPSNQDLIWCEIYGILRASWVLNTMGPSKIVKYRYDSGLGGMSPKHVKYNAMSCGLTARAAWYDKPRTATCSHGIRCWQ